MNSLSGDFNAKVDREDNFKPTIGNEGSHKIGNDNGVSLSYLKISVKSMMFTNPSIHKYTLTSPDGKTHSDGPLPNRQ
jgi:hypothetical protein